MAEGILRSLLPEDLAQVVRVSSSGTGASDGLPATKLAIEVSADSKVDLKGHRSRVLTPGTLRASDLILAMEPHHIDYARGLAPEVANRIHLITEKGTALTEKNNQYQVVVDKHANKLDIKYAVEQAFKVKVVGVNTMHVRGKFRRQMIGGRKAMNPGADYDITGLHW